jgi:CRP-like cAMP-binding protein
MTADLERATRAYHRAQQAVDKRREELAEAIAAADATGMKQVDIVQITGYTREHVRRIVGAAKAAHG